MTDGKIPVVHNSPFLIRWEGIETCLLCSSGSVNIGGNSEFHLTIIALGPLYKTENKAVSIYINGKIYGQWLESFLSPFYRLKIPLILLNNMDIQLHASGGDIYLCGNFYRKVI